MAETKTCPECAEQVQSAAKRCKHCGHDFSTGWLAVDLIVKVVCYVGIGVMVVVGIAILTQR